MEENTEPKESVESASKIDKFAVDWALCQGEFSAISLDKAAFGYKYASLANMIKSTKPVLMKHGFSFVQLIGGDDSRQRVTTILIHKSGQTIKTSIQCPGTTSKKSNAVQSMGATITYLRRYALGAILGIACDDDVDGVVAEAPVKQYQNVSRQKPPSRNYAAELNKKLIVLGLNEEEVRRFAGDHNINSNNGESMRQWLSSDAVLTKKVNDWMEKQLSG